MLAIFNKHVFYKALFISLCWPYLNVKYYYAIISRIKDIDNVLTTQHQHLEGVFSLVNLEGTQT